MKEILSTLIAFYLLFITQTSSAKIYTSFLNNNAVSGYDVVAYFTQNKPVKGDKRFAYKYDGATWLFSSQENLDSFKKSPEKYTPQYGGHCAWAVAHKNTLVSASPLAWKIVNNKLYLNYDAKIQKIWEKDIPRFISQGDRNWPQLKQ